MPATNADIEAVAKAIKQAVADQGVLWSDGEPWSEMMVETGARIDLAAVSAAAILALSRAG